MREKNNIMIYLKIIKFSHHYKFPLKAKKYCSKIPIFNIKNNILKYKNPVWIKIT